MKSKSRRCLFGLLLCLSLWIALYPASASSLEETEVAENALEGQALEVVILDVGHGDCIYIDFPDRPDMIYDDMLIDAGTPSRGAEKLRQFLEERDEEKVDLVLVSHAHLDHFGGFLELLEEVEYERFLYSGTSYSSQTFKNLMNLVEERAETIGKGDKIDVDYDEEDDLLLDILYPETLAESEQKENNNSIVVKLTFGQQVFLLTGDIEEEAEEELCQAYGEQLKSTILKVPHHGSLSSSSQTFVALVAPEFAVICTDGKRYGLPRDEVLERYEDINAVVLRTDHLGDISFFTDGSWLRVETKRVIEDN